MDITNEQWQRIAEYIPKPKAQPGKSGRPPQNPRDVLNGILWILRTGAPWAELQIIGDRAYDSDKLDKRLAEERGVEMLAPHRRNRRKATTQDGRTLRRYRKRWKVERLFAWLQNFRRLVVRYEYHLKNFLAMIQLGCIVIVLRRVLG